MARYIKRFMGYSYSLSQKDVNSDNLCYLINQLYINKNKFDDTKHLYINNFQQSISTPNKSGEIVINYYDGNENIGLTQYNIKTGEIGMIIINRDYRGKSLGKQIVCNIIEDMRLNNLKEVWVQSPRNQVFWSNVFNKAFTFRSPINSDKGGRGFFMKI